MVGKKKGVQIGIEEEKEMTEMQTQMRNVSVASGIELAKIPETPLEVQQEAIRANMKGQNRDVIEQVVLHLTDNIVTDADSTLALIPEISRNVPKEGPAREVFESAIIGVGEQQTRLNKLTQGEEPKGKEQNILQSMVRFNLARAINSSKIDAPVESSTFDVKLLAYETEYQRQFELNKSKGLSDEKAAEEAAKDTFKIIREDRQELLSGRANEGVSQEQASEDLTSFQDKIMVYFVAIRASLPAIASENQEAVTEISKAENMGQIRETAMKYDLMSEFAFSSFIGTMGSILSSGIGETQAPIGAGMAAGQAWLANEMQRWVRLDEQRAEEAENLLNGLKKREEQGKVAELKDEFKSQLENFGIASDSTIEEAVEFMNNIIAQNTAVSELKERGEEGLIPSFNTDPVRLLESHGLMEDGKLTEQGAERFSELLEKSAGDFQESVDIVALRLPMESEAEIREEGEIVRAYMINPSNDEKRQAAMEVLANPEFIAIRAAFLDALSENISKVMPAALKGFE